MPLTGATRRFATLVVVVGSFVFLLFFFTARDGIDGVPSAGVGDNIIPEDGYKAEVHISPGKAIAPKLGNETVKAELGRAAWKVFHTTLARFPDKPAKDESSALKSYIYLFQRLYPCGECANHFGELLQQYPPQVSSRSAAAGWGCHIHNKVNQKLKKEEFDCAKIGDFYDCGCAEDDKGDKDEAAQPVEEKPEMSDAAKEKLAGDRGRLVDENVLLKLEKEEYQRGG